MGLDISEIKKADNGAEKAQHDKQSRLSSTAH